MSSSAQEFLRWSLLALSVVLAITAELSLMGDRLAAGSSTFTEFYTGTVMYIKTVLFAALPILLAATQLFSYKYGDLNYLARHRFLSLVVFVALAGSMIAAVVQKSYIQHQILYAVDTETKLTRMHSVFYNSRCSLYYYTFSCVCTTYNYMDQCSAEIVSQIFDGDVPSKLWFEIIARLEETEHCASFSYSQWLGRVFYTGYRTSVSTCTFEHLSDFSHRNLDSFWLVQLFSWIAVGFSALNTIVVFWYYNKMSKRIDGDGQPMDLSFCHQLTSEAQ